MEDVNRFEITQGSDGFQIRYQEKKVKRFALPGMPSPLYDTFRGQTFPTLEAAEQALKDKFERRVVAVYAVKP